ncbi:MAG: hypothetical protein E7409_05475 [Ruminococcaceae bacterium]|nr:hypothetical protein [Oscillospiraceae bacterium]
MDSNQFDRALSRANDNARERTGIGRLSEKVMHAALKYYLEPDERYHEIPVGRYVADIAREDGIVEIQTRSLDRLRDKLDAFLSLGRVTVVYPIPHIKHLKWLDPQTGEISKARKSPKTGTFSDAFYELYRICPQLSHPHLHIKLLLLDVEEIRFLDGWSYDKKRGSTRCNRVPTALAGELTLTCPQDYAALLPAELPEVFTAKELSKAAHISPKVAARGIRVLCQTGCIVRDGKRGRAYVYRIT